MKTLTDFHYRKSRKTKIIQFFFIISHSDFMISGNRKEQMVELSLKMIILV